MGRNSVWAEDHSAVLQYIYICRYISLVYIEPLKLGSQNLMWSIGCGIPLSNMEMILVVSVLGCVCCEHTSYQNADYINFTPSLRMWFWLRNWPCPIATHCPIWLGGQLMYQQYLFFTLAIMETFLPHYPIQLLSGLCGVHSCQARLDWATADFIFVIYTILVQCQEGNYMLHRTFTTPPKSHAH